jgi:hypothetical protein
VYGAIALANNLTLVTHNTWEFERVDGLQFKDWVAFSQVLALGGDRTVLRIEVAKYALKDICF